MQTAARGPKHDGENNDHGSESNGHRAIMRQFQEDRAEHFYIGDGLGHIVPRIASVAAVDRHDPKRDSTASLQFLSPLIMLLGVVVVFGVISIGVHYLRNNRPSPSTLSV